MSIRNIFNKLVEVFSKTEVPTHFGFEGITINSSERLNIYAPEYNDCPSGSRLYRERSRDPTYEELRESCLKVIGRLERRYGWK